MAKAKNYTREQLNDYTDSIEDQENNLNRLDILINKAGGLTNPKLSHDEKKWLYESVIMNSLYFQNDDWNERLPILSHKYLSDYRFLYLFIDCNYANDLNGYMKHKHILFDKEFTKSDNEKNVEFLKKITEDWEKIIKNRTHSDQLLSKISTEATKMIEAEFQSASLLGANWKKNKKQQLLLFYKFIYLKGKEVFRDSNSFTLNIYDQEIIYDYESYVHISRHFGRTLKPDLLNKTFFTQDFLPANIFDLLKEIFDLIKANNVIKPFEIVQNHQLFFELNSVVYTLWINETSNDAGKMVLKVKSLYPSTSYEEKQKWTILNKIKVNSNLYFFEKT